MTISCYCDNFDKSDFDNWWEPGGRCMPPKGEKCCECGADLPAGVPCASFDHMEVWEPEDEPEHPDNMEGNEHLTDGEFATMEQAFHDFRDNNGWDLDVERYERCKGTDYRCERCEDLADSIEALGYCMIGPGDLISSHLAFVNEHRYAPRKWIRNKDGVLNPVPWSQADHFRAWRRKKWAAISWKTKIFYWTWRGRIKRAFA